MYSLVIPVYKNAASLPELLTELDGLRSRLDAPLELIFVVDGSPDESYAILKAGLAGRPTPSRLIRLTRNRGSAMAIRIGLAKATGAYVARLAADLQEPPAMVLAFFLVLRDEPVDVVLGVRETRADPLGSRLMASLYWRFYRRFVLKDMPLGGADAFGCNRKARDALCGLAMSNVSPVSLLIWLGLPRKLVFYHRLARPYGKSAWTFRRKVRHAFENVFALRGIAGAEGGATGMVDPALILSDEAFAEAR